MNLTIARRLGMAALVALLQEKHGFRLYRLNSGTAGGLRLVIIPREHD